MTFNTFETLALAGFVLLLGYFLVKRISLLKSCNIPEPVVGGFLVAIILTVLYQGWGLSFMFDTNLQFTMMLVFFSSIGLSANFARLVKGGKPLIIFVIAATLLITVQNIVGVTGSVLLGIDPAYGLIAGSVTLTGGHGTGAAWAGKLTELFHLEGALELAMACATFGLVSGGIIGGPVARHLLGKMKHGENPESDDVDDVQEAFEHPTYQRKITTRSLIETITMMTCCLLIGQFLDAHTKGSVIELPTFVWCLFTGVIIRNSLTHIFKFNVADSAVDVLGNVGLSLFLAIALMSLKLWQLAGLALPVMVILAIQVVLMAVFAVYVTYRIMGKDYDAVVLSAGHCGFGLGATPTAVANMQAVTSRFGPSHKAFLIVPMVGAFFIDLVNASVLKVFLFVVSALH
ncbi:sodium/glutamate symport carrier protein GltS [Aggregatibacter actinomycetemcomitans serotype d str. SA3033]|uniref:Sodium/glutamate symporter n=2 Tax=Aggregatibacter actinomycetemcomitans TaxID=714 RepID=A0AB74N6M6_AGGAC|nr:sodium/glutamate symporter [Aggregatibacter actinomycetemcomitans]AFI86798.1 sodium:glutamate symporter [Aggregatibacter actinomycetemcomitans D7S-1]KYK95551.1 sodium/glutamate symport carrier protein GltS [Aggregatibacter actinomycetemcomitans serotype d str. SA3733]EKX99070.1 sodium/glutamate symporter [Aggregatibacter actinomycetemcomitans Y4]KND85640.1 sodium:glutamate symporter [Aggregatibacter actinomycetemcomitans serotype a str. H5P1]KOE31145.1 sodium:glutamate symporter [Aggregatib